MNRGTIQERHIGIVTSVDDPEQKGRIQARCDTLLGTGRQLPFWIEPAPMALGGQSTGLVDAGVWYFPTNGQQVELIATVGHDRDQVSGQASIDAPAVTWSHSKLTDADSIPAPLLVNYPSRRGWIVPTGSGWFLDDTGSDEMFGFNVQNLDASWNHFMLLGRVGAAPDLQAFTALDGFLVHTQGGHEIKVDDGATEVKITHSAGAEIVIDSSGNIFVTAAANVHLNDAAAAAGGVVRDTDVISFALTDSMGGAVNGTITHAGGSGTVKAGG